MSTMPRITFLGANRTAQLRLRQAYRRLDQANQQAATGRAYSRPSENTSASGRAATVQAQMDQMTSYDRSIQDSLSHLAVADTKMSQAVSLYQRVTELATQGASSTNSPDARAAIGQEIDQIRGELQAIGNTTYLGQPIFGGLGSGDPVNFNSGTSTWTFSGAPSERLTRNIGPSESVDISVTAGEIFSNGTDNIFAVLDSLSTALNSNDTAGIQAAIPKITTFRSVISAGQARIGAVTNRVEQASSRNASMIITFTDELSKLQEVDLADAITNQSRLNIAYQSALGVTAKAQEKTLLDWLR
jgi:flagellar hook-associated protein 3 FlgL